MTTQFTTHETFFCKWEGGAKEYFPTLEDALNKAKEMYIRTPKMSDENYEYWLTQKQIIGKQITITQVLETISFPELIATI